MALAELAARQFGVVALQQVLELGLTKDGIAKRKTAGRLHGLHRGVYAVGHRHVSWDGRLMAAVLACGEGAVLSHRSAAERWNLRRSGSTRIDVTSPRRTGRTRGDIVTHSGASLRAADVTVIDGIPCTGVARTLLDLAEVVEAQALQRAVERAEVLRVLDLSAIQRVLAQSAGRRGAPRLARAIASHRPTVTRSELEDRFLAICQRAGLPRPVANAWLPEHAVEADFAWPDRALVVELDGYDAHGTREAFARDRRRDRRLRRAGWRVERFTWREIAEEPTSIVAELEAILGVPASPR